MKQQTFAHSLGEQRSALGGGSARTKSGTQLRASHAFEVGGHRLTTTPVFDTYWRFACERQEVFFNRLEGRPAPWTTDAIIGAHRFTNVYRAADRVSQYLIRNVLYEGPQDSQDMVFRLLLFKLFNKIPTWEALESKLGDITWRTYRFDHYASILDQLHASHVSIYSPAYIMPSPPFGEVRKHRNHLKLIEAMMASRLPAEVERCKSLAALFDRLLSYPSLGRFLAFQLAIDINYSPLCDFSEMDFVVAGPGARDGVAKCFVDLRGVSEEAVIEAMARRAEDEFARLGLRFRDLWGRPLQLIDCQNLFCEVDKYARVAHPEYSGESGRTRIKQKFAASGKELPQSYPPKWGITPTLGVGAARQLEISATAVRNKQR